MAKQQKKKSTALKLSDIKRRSKEIKTKDVYTFDDGKTLKYYPVFANTKIDELIEELKEKVEYIEEKGIEISDKMFNYYILFLCIKYFTDLEKIIPDTFEEQLALWEELYNSDYFIPFVENAFDSKQISKVFDRIADILSSYYTINKIFMDAQKKFETLQLKNKEILGVLNQENNDAS
ncbi:hypothetical protein [Bacillus smithii]|uniref:hypothetical protein n=1 Tax=Bacillus smithii TaxID=1479 RepID=UPI002E1EF45E|nr:hypothetical protein [Bacillus smithii]MED4929127.1 hypothetical protein [Bacillus smithii]